MVAELLSHYPVLFTMDNGQLDVICAYPQTVHFLKRLKFDGADEYKNAERHVWRVNNELAGYIKQAGNLTEILLRNAGKLIIKASLIFKRFIQTQKFYLEPNFHRMISTLTMKK